MVKKLKLIYFFKQAAEAFSFSFLSLFLVYKGLSDSQAELLIAVVPLVMVFAMPLIGLYDNGPKRESHILAVSSIAVMILLASAFFLADDFLLLAVFVVVSTLFRAAFQPCYDSLVSAVSLEKGVEFSSIRVWSSIAYLISMTLGGFLLDKFGFFTMFLTSCALYLISGILVFFLKVETINAKTLSARTGDYRILFRNKRFLSYVLLVGLTYAILGATNNFDLLYYMRRFEGASLYGLSEGVRVLFEATTMFLFAKIGRKVKIKTLYILTAAATVLKCVAFALSAPIYVFFALSPVIGALYGMTIAIQVRYPSRLVCRENIHISVSVTVIATQAMNALFTILGSVIVEYFALSKVYLMLSGVAAIGLFYALFLYKDSSFAAETHAEIPT